MSRMASPHFLDFCKWLNILPNAPFVIMFLPWLFRPSRDLRKIFGYFECYKYPVPDGTSPLHDSQIRPKSFFTLVQQSVLDFRFQNVLF